MTDEDLIPEAERAARRRTRAGALAAKRARRQRQRIVLGVVALLAVVSGVGYAVARSGVFTHEPLSESTPVSVATSTPEPTATIEPTATAEATLTPDPTEVLKATVIEIGWVGDTTPGSKYGNPPDSGRALFEYAREYTTQPDIMIANLEGTFGNGGTSKCDEESTNCYAFQAAPENASALAWAGFDVLNLANNHSYDYLAAGQQSTREALSANDLAYTGLVDTVAIKEVEGVRVAVLGFSPYSWSPDIGELEAAQALVRRTDEDADVVIVVMHAGAEGADKIHTPQGSETAYGEFRGDSRAFSHAVIDAGADLVLGSGPHVVRGLEEYQGRLIAYSLGNFAGWRNFSRSGDLALSGLLTVRINGEGRVLGGKWLSLKIEEPGVPHPDPGNDSLALVQQLSAEDFDTPIQLAEDGTFQVNP